MLKHFSNREIKRYVLTAAIVILVGFTGYFYVAREYVLHALLMEKLTANINESEHVYSAMNYLAARDGFWNVDRYRDVLVHLAERMDATSNSYAELFDEDFTSLSIRTPVFPTAAFSPHDFPELMEQLRTQESGSHVILFDP